MLKIAMYDTKPYDKLWFDKLAPTYGAEVRYLEPKLTQHTAMLAQGCQVVCAFVNDDITAEVIQALCEQNIRLIALRSAGYNNVDYKAAFGKIHVVRVPAYSPESVAEHAAALLLSVNRKIHRAYVRTRENNFNISGLMGFNLHGKTAGVVGTGKIGKAFVRIMQGFGMRVIAYDPYPDETLGAEYMALDELLAQADIISLHSPLTNETKHMIDEKSIKHMKKGVLLVNTSRGPLVDTKALIQGLRSGKIGGVGLDVYEEESEYFYEDFSNEIVKDDDLAILLSMPNVLMTSHQAFLTNEALEKIAEVTLQNIQDFAQEKPLVNEVCYQCVQTGVPCPKSERGGRCF